MKARASYRHVWLVKTRAGRHRARTVSSSHEQFREQHADRFGQGPGANRAAKCPARAASVVVAWEILAPDGKVRARGGKTAPRLRGGRLPRFGTRATAIKPELWSPETDRNSTTACDPPY